jgi:hypothetical protein
MAMLASGNFYVFFTLGMVVKILFVVALELGLPVVRPEPAVRKAVVS